MIRLAKEAEEDEINKANYKIGELAEIDRLYKPNEFDIVILSGVVCFLDEPS